MDHGTIPGNMGEFVCLAVILSNRLGHNYNSPSEAPIGVGVFILYAGVRETVSGARHRERSSVSVATC